MPELWYGILATLLTISVGISAISISTTAIVIKKIAIYAHEASRSRTLVRESPTGWTLMSRPPPPARPAVERQTT